MSLEISPAAASWQKRFPAAVRLASGGKRSKSTGVMPSSEAEIDMSALLARIGRTHDVADFELLFRHFAPRVKAYMARTGSAAAAEELMQETMIAVWNKAGLYQPGKGAASTWIFTIARNLRIDAFRRERHPEFDDNDPAFQPEIAPAADNRLEGEESANLVREGLAALPPDQAEVLRLAFFEDKSQSTIATALGLPLGTVKSRMRLAFAKLRGVVEASGDRP